MVLYNVTVSLDPDCVEEWLAWMRSTHIPDVINTGCFVESRLSRVVGEEEGGETYAITYVAPSEEKLEEYKVGPAKALQQEHQDKFSGKFVAFRTLLNVIEEFKK